ncbi:uncharacterized protein K441DRAFT_677132 [Cenococcum geophilum 1.58]|uniref:uncharacterized protein n=1 Tax=Cenococcum geophilum 1.58 TaxID=794803 RepID=UPI00358F71A1|nr:hypothetical protein K441DRAFT_677132 [Cenococcum geophilum 1.58]
MYGLGIRIGYYLQWYGGILAAWIAPEESSSLRLANALFVAATFLALFIQTIQEHAEKSFPIVETYIILFLAFGSYLVLVPIYLWRIFTCCNPYLDPTRFPRVNPGRVYGYMNSVLLTAVLGFELWYWIHQVPKLATVKCVQYGFFFHKIQLNNRGFRMLNIIFCLFLLLCCITLVCMKVVSKVRPSQGKKVILKKEQYKPLDQDLPKRAHLMQILDSTSQFIVATTVIIGVELTICWNKIQDVHDISSAGQTIPMILGIGALIRVIYVWKFKKVAHEAVSSDPQPAGYHIVDPHNGFAQPPPPTPWHQMPAPQSPAPSPPPPNQKPTSWDSMPAAARESVHDLGHNPNYYSA